jgi:hypothetical protein
LAKHNGFRDPPGAGVERADVDRRRAPGTPLMFAVGDRTGSLSGPILDVLQLRSRVSDATRDAMEAGSLTMSGPPKKSSPASGEPESQLLRVKRLRQEAEEFHRTVGEELRTTRALLEDLSVRQAKRRGHGR